MRANQLLGLGLALVLGAALLRVGSQDGDTSSAQAADPAPKDHPNRVAGTWRLVSVVRDPGGVALEPFGLHPRGQLIFTRNGRWSSFIQDPDVPEFAAGSVD